jgi:hypothetical protein
LLPPLIFSQENAQMLVDRLVPLIRDLRASPPTA